VLTLTLAVGGVTAFVPTQPQQQHQQRYYTTGRPNVNIHHLKSNTILHLSSSPNPNNENDDNENLRIPTNVPINTTLIRQLVFNQGLIGYSIWNKGLGYEVLTRDANFNPFTTPFVPLAILGVLPLLALSYSIETSESPLVSTLNLSTDMQMLRIFGPKARPLVALGISAALAGLTGLVEEVTFRGEILPTLAQWSTVPGNLPFTVDPSQGIYYGVALSTIIFAALHVNPLGLFKGKEAAIDALVLFGLQLSTGGTFAALYLASGNLAVPIVSHGLYDFYTFYKTHLVVTGQMEYVETNIFGTGNGDGNGDGNGVGVGEKGVGRAGVDNGDDGALSQIESKWIDMRGSTFVREARQTFYLMDTNRDGVVSREELRIALYSYGINLSKGESEVILDVADVDGSGGIDFDEFLSFMGPEGSTSKAIKGSLLGVL